MLLTILFSLFLSPSVALPSQKINGGVRVEKSDEIAKRTVYVSGYMRCSGTVIGSSWVVTAAHCVVDGSGQLRDVSVRFGVNPAKPDAHIKALKVIFHHRYDPRDRLYTYFDIALVELEKKIPAGYRIVPLARELPVEHETVTSAGFGRGGGKVLNKVELAFISGTKNHPSLQVEMSAQRGFCNGDSGGSLYNQWGALVGVHEGGTISDTSHCNGPGRVTSVPYFHQWILDSMKLGRSVGEGH